MLLFPFPENCSSDYSKLLYCPLAVLFRGPYRISYMGVGFVFVVGVVPCTINSVITGEIEVLLFSKVVETHALFHVNYRIVISPWPWIVAGALSTYVHYQGEGLH